MTQVKPMAGEQFEYAFSYTQSDVEKFAAVTGDVNPVHLDADYAATTPFKKPIMHGFLSGSVFSKVFGTIFPGNGTIYLSQQLVFKRPMYVDEPYTAQFTITTVDDVKCELVVACKIVSSNGKVCLEGEAKLMNKRVFQS